MKFLLFETSFRLRRPERQGQQQQQQQQQTSPSPPPSSPSPPALAESTLSRSSKRASKRQGPGVVRDPPCRPDSGPSGSPGRSSSTDGEPRAADEGGEDPEPHYLGLGVGEALRDGRVESLWIGVGAMVVMVFLVVVLLLLLLSVLAALWLLQPAFITWLAKR